MRTPYIVGIGGTTRAGSSTEKALRFTLGACEELGATVLAFTGRDLMQLPMYAPEDPQRTEFSGRFVSELRRADGLVVASSSYHGSLSGLIKNALDYAEDLREDDRSYFSHVPVGCIATGAGWQGVVCTLEHLRSIVHALRGWPTPLGAAINSTMPVFGPDGDVTDERVRFQLTTVAEEVMMFVRMRLAAVEAAGT